MPAKVTDRATDFREVHRWAGGVGWMTHPTEIMRRTSHALATDEGVLIVDPVDADGLSTRSEILDKIRDGPPDI